MTAAIPSHVQVVFFQGIFSTFYQVDRTVNTLFSSGSVSRIYSDTDLDEIVPFRFTLNPLYLLQMFFSWITGRWGAPYAIDISKVNIGQKSDINALLKRERRLNSLDEHYCFWNISWKALTTFVRYALESSYIKASQVRSFGRMSRQHTQMS